MEKQMANWRIGTLFRRRLSRFWSEQWKVWRTALDWTVWVYFILPLLWIGGGTYVDLWHHPADWLVKLPLWTGERLPLVVIFVGRLRTFTEEADVLFLLQKQSWGRGLLRRGAVYTALMLLVLTALVYVLLFPFFLAVHHFPASAIIAMVLYTWMWAMIGAMGRNIIEARFIGFRKWAMKTAAMLLLAATYLIPMIVLGTSPLDLLVPILAGAVAAVLLLRLKLRARDAFESDVQQEQLARLASTQLLLRNVIRRKPRVKLSRPILLRRSNRIFKKFDGETILGEMIIKAFIRRLPLVRTWLIFIFLSAAAVLLSPGVIKPFVAVALMLLLSSWVISHWRGMTAEPYFKQFRWTDAALRDSAKRVRFWLVVPAAALFGLIDGMQTYGPGGFVAIVPGVLIWLLICNLVSSTMLLRTERKEEEA
ncbi:ABC transporter permease [Paenibacillus sacheonensis]|uniref:Uncharacterized protein n=1 Tax=Paenibacillus sacheonensis TaxID=742054 RepID=A0A7X5C0K5_9BACL|nr:ABC transporter permease [Paenibacillus sacheonensis]MBM7564812.1 ABC-2 type transport system permease protein [Paenibacillus sacheonensis]NBC69360.1 hypothetical protein [Paenibacillus sacheonensis]